MGANPEIGKIEIDQKGLKNLNTIRKWTMFLAVSGFIFLGLMITIGAITGIFLSAFKADQTSAGFAETYMLLFFLVLAIACFFPLFYLFRFSKYTTHAVNNLDKQELYEAIQNLKHFFVYLGILIIIVLTFYIIALIAAGSSMAFLKGM